MVTFYVDVNGAVMMIRENRAMGESIGSRPSYPASVAEADPMALITFDTDVVKLLERTYELGRRDKAKEIRDALLG